MLNIKKTNNLKGETMTKLPKIRLRLTKSRSKTKHTLEQMKVCYDAIASQAGLEIDSYEKSLKSIKEGKDSYIIQCTGWSYDSWVAGDYEKANEIWYNRGELPFVDNAFDLRTAILDEYISMYVAIKDFGFVLEKNDSNYSELVQDYDRSKYLLDLTREQRQKFWSFEYNYNNQIREERA
jgi:type III secretory pathway component EscV